MDGRSVEQFDGQVEIYYTKSSTFKSHTMSITACILLMAGLGGLGGFVNCLLSGEVHWPRFEKDTRIWRPGVIGNIAIGAVAAVMVWGIYGPASTFDLIENNPKKIILTLGQLLGSLGVGLSGGKILTLISQKQADQVAKEKLVELSKNLTPKSGDQV